MAFSQSVKKGQLPLYCRLCETETKITCKCIECNLLMCTNCKNRIHPKIAKNHRVVDIKDIKDQIAGEDVQEMDFTNLKCHEHSGQINCMFCKSCDQLVCPLCISKLHNGHGLVEIREGYEIQTIKLGDIENEISAELEKLHNNKSKIKKIQKSEKFRYQDVKERIQEQNVALKEAVDQYTNELLQKLQQNWTDLKNSLDSVQEKITKKSELLKEKKSKIKNLIRAYDIQEVFSEVQNITKISENDQTSFKLLFEPMPVFNPGEISQYNFGELHQSLPTAINIDITKCFTTKLGVVGLISVNPDDSLWINNGIQKLLQKVKPERDNLRTISSYNMMIYGMALTPSNDILLATGKSTLQMISHDRGQLKDTHYIVSLPCCSTVHVTGQNKVIVGAWDGEKGAVIVMDMEGKHEKKYEKNRNGEDLFIYPRQITSTRNRNIFVMDKLSDDGKGRVVILKQTGDVVNMYTGHLYINDDDRPFLPVDMTCTPSDNVIVTDMGTEYIHILNNTGYFIKYCHVESGIQCPLSLAFSRSGKLYIGCTQKIGRTENNAKIYQVNTSGF